MTSESTGSSGRRGARDLRSELLRTSRQLLDESGPGALSMREVARRAGCTHQAPYHYFANREAILAALVHEGFDELADRLASAHEGLESTDLRAILTASGNAYVEFALRHPGVFRVMFRPDVCDPERFPEVVQAGGRARGELARLVKVVLGDDAPLEVEVLFWSGVHGLASLLLDGPLAGEFTSVEERIDFARGVVGLTEIPFTDITRAADEGC
ncbi:TetR/AcrR family transcriptional regulator [Actinomyces sp. oral taxon 170]|jgi:transcriptional regulator, TetR family|uniref:TetR/AcrR family transcriptional regulator n=1 Tax=Actinomyces sp. oral taxon 170 TaxID=712117 RepID=UPI000205E8F5|nr:TetR/AcrR family transcriptional regulator [Actinomyces sp. oral taxon 170]EGF58175.1 transcriptional regulator, TetR family [Actinomyces sp. oral taxon 170 str. F0386]